MTDQRENAPSIRLLNSLKKELKKAAEKNKRSYQAEAELRLQQSLRAEQILEGADTNNPQSLILAALDTIRIAEKVIESNLLKLAASKGKVRIEENSGEYNLPGESKELLNLIEQSDPDTVEAVLKILKSSAK